jgi:hypothetical protein
MGRSLCEAQNRLVERILFFQPYLPAYNSNKIATKILVAIFNIHYSFFPKTLQV